jgi:hypothetical protein
MDVERAVKALAWEGGEVKARLERLAERFLLRLGW